MDGGFDATGEDHPAAGLAKFGVFEAIAEWLAVSGGFSKTEPALSGPEARGGRCGFEDSLVAKAATDALGLLWQGLRKRAKGYAIAALLHAGLYAGLDRLLDPGVDRGLGCGHT